MINLSRKQGLVCLAIFLVACGLLIHAEIRLEQARANLVKCLEVAVVAPIVEPPKVLPKLEEKKK